jgi:hypothetical protein
MTRLEALEAVAEAVRKCRAGDVRWSYVMQTLAALDALPAAPAQAQGEAVEVAVWEDPTDGDIQLARIGGGMDRNRLQYPGWTRLGATLLPIRAAEGGGE